MRLSLRSPAKINLFLRVLGKREDGYHELASLFQTIDLCDTIHFSLAEKDHFTCSDPNLSFGESNTIQRALTLFRKKTGIHHFFRIHLEKRIPQEAGLGGGSSNGATTLYALNQLTGQKIAEESLRFWSREIGADVPFFFSTGTAYCEGIGEKVTSLPPLAFLQDKKIVIVKPKEGLSTKAIFGQLNLDECSLEDPQKILHHFLNQNPNFINDLEKVAYRLSPELENVRKYCISASKSVFMTGSGSAHIALIPFQENEFFPNRSNLFFHAACLPIVRKNNEWY